MLTYICSQAQKQSLNCFIELDDVSLLIHIRSMHREACLSTALGMRDTTYLDIIATMIQISKATRHAGLRQSICSERRHQR